MIKEYRTIREISGPLMIVKDVQGVPYDELAEIELPSGETRRCRVLEVDGGNAVVQLFESSSGINLAESKIRFLGRGMELGVSGDMLGRVFDGMGRPIDGGPNTCRKMDGRQRAAYEPHGSRLPSNLYRQAFRARRAEHSRKRPEVADIFGPGLPHASLAAQIARQAKVWAPSRSLPSFSPPSDNFEESEFFVNEFRRTGAIDRTVMFANLANDPAVERIATPRMALTAAEYLAFEKNMHVLVIITDITNYAEALREISAARKEVPGRRGYPGYLYTDLATMYERAGRRKGKDGSITMIPILTMPEDDITHPYRTLPAILRKGSSYCPESFT
jgi:V/A-type H+-transporting ATPase subunit B